MPIKGSISVQGLPELRRKLMELEPKIRAKVIKKAAIEALQPTLHAARAQAPMETGLLVSTLEVKGKASTKKIGATLQTRGGNFKGHTFYASFIEFGHHVGKRITNTMLGLRKRMRRGKEISKIISDVNAARPFIPANPFMRKAFDETKEEVLRIFAGVVKEGIITIAKYGPGVRRNETTGRFM